MNEILYTLLTAVIAAVASAITAYLKKKLSPGELASLVDLARLAVHAAEKAGEDQGLRGVDKYRLAASGLTALAKRVGIKLTPDEVATLIHAVLRELEPVTVAG